MFLDLDFPSIKDTLLLKYDVVINTSPRVDMVLSKACNFIKQETPVQLFPCEFYESFKKIFFTEQLRAAAPANTQLFL